MYCDRCGKQLDDQLNYCNGCGALLRRDTTPPPKSLAGLMIGSLAFIIIFGLLVLSWLMVTLLERSRFPEPVFAFGVAYLVMLFGICFLMVRQISKVIDADLRAREFPKRNAGQPIVQLPPRSTSQLEEFREPASVTDHTTRTLEPTRLREP